MKSFKNIFAALLLCMVFGVSNAQHPFLHLNQVYLTGSQMIYLDGYRPEILSIWVTDANGIHNEKGNVGIGMNSASTARLSVRQEATGGYSGAMDITSNDTYQTVITFRNETIPVTWSMMVSGNNNPYQQQPGSFALYNNQLNNWVLNTNPDNSYLAIGSTSNKTQTPKSRLHVFAGDVNINDIGRGIILKSPNGKCWRITIDNQGNLVRKPISCP